MLYIYSRVSTGKQDTANQLARLRELYPTAPIYEETASGAKRRPVLEGLLARLQKGDYLVVAALDRLGRKTSEILALIENLEKRGGDPQVSPRRRGLLYDYWKTCNADSCRLR
jgi:putative DNA-invertase from lambdoid prophage Rac